MMKKVIDAIKKGIFFYKLREKIHKIIRENKNILYIKNYDIKSLAYQCKDYQRLYNQFKGIIEKGVSICDNHQQSNKVWVCWFQGYELAPPLVKACINSIYKTMPDKEIIILTDKNYKQYIQIPDYIEKKYMNGQIGRAHFSDILRISLLAKWGGMWLDSTILCTDSKFFEYVSKKALFVFKQLNLSNKDNAPIIASSWFITCEIGNPIIILTRDLLYAYWKHYNFIINYFIFHFFFAMSCRRYNDQWENIPVFNNHSPHILMFELDKNYSKERWQQIISMSDIHKLQRYDDYSKLKNSNYCKILNEYL